MNTMLRYLFPLTLCLAFVTGSCLYAVPSPAPTAQFAGISDTGWLPPDTNAAVGPSHIVGAVNGGILIQNRSGVTISQTSLDTFWRNIGITFSKNTFDPRILYDAINSRWVMCVVTDGSATTSKVHVATSLTNDPTGSWRSYSFQADSSGATWADYPTLGINGKWAVVTCNMFTLAGSYTTSKLWAFPLQGMYAGNTITATTWTRSEFTIAPAVNMDTGTADLYLVSSFNSGAGTVKLLKISGNVGSETLTDLGLLTGPGAWGNSGNSTNPGPQGGTAQNLNLGDSRMHSVVVRGGELWATHHVFLPASNPTRCSIQWWRINPAAATVTSSGRIDDSSGTNFYSYPSVAVNAAGDVMIGCSQMTASTFPSAAYVFRAAGESSFRDPYIYKAGRDEYEKFDGSGRNRWGDYSSTAVDPTDNSSFWTLQEYSELRSSGNSRWGTWWAKVPGSAAQNSVLQFAASTYAVGEAGSPVVLTVTRSGNTRTAVSVAYTTGNGTAVAGQDFTTTSGTLSFGADVTSRTISVPIVNDVAAESDESFTVTLSSPGAGAVLGSPGSASVVITDNDAAPPAVSIVTSDSSASESGDSGSFVVSRSVGAGTALVVNIAISGTATSGSDYPAMGTTVTIPAGSTSVTVGLNPIDDALVEATETVVLTVVSGTGYTVGGNAAATVNILDNDIATTVRVQATDSTAGESGDTGVFTLTRDGAITAALNVAVSFSGTATAGSDYTSVATITIPAGSNTASMTLTAINDVLVEGAETVVLTVAAGAGYSVGSPSAATITIADNDVAVGNDMFAGRFSFTSLGTSGTNSTATKEVGEPNHANNVGGASIWWEWVATFNGSVTFDTLNTLFDTTLGIYTGTSVGALTLVGSDDDGGTNGTSRVTFTAVSGTSYKIAVDGYNGARGTVFLNRTPDPVQLATVTINATDSAAQEGTTDQGAFTITRTAPLTNALQVLLTTTGTATNGGDYQALALTVTIPAGQANVVLPVVPLDDATIEGGETIIVSIANSASYTVGAPNSATVNLADNDTTVGNDLFINAAVMTQPSLTGLNTGASKEVGEPLVTTNPGGVSVWWRWTATFSGPVSFDTVGSSFDTLLGCYTGSAVNALTLVAENDDSTGNTSLISFTAVSGTTYFLMVDGYKSGINPPATGTIVLTRTGDPVPRPVVTVSTPDASAKEGSGDVGSIRLSRTGPTTAALACTVAFSGTATNTADYNTIATTLTIPIGAVFLDVSVVPVDDVLVEGPETVILTLQPAPGYELDNGQAPYEPGGRIVGTVVIADNDTTSNNDHFAQRTIIPAGASFSVTGNNLVMTKETGEPLHAGNAGGKSAWWQWTAPQNGSVTIHTNGSNYDTTLGIYTGSSVSTLTLVAGDDDAGDGFSSLVTFNAIGGTVYMIAVDGYSGASGSIVLSGLFTGPPPPVITSALTASGTQNVPFSYTILATNGPHTFSAAGLPSGLSLTAGGVISGIPVAEGIFPVAITATSVGGFDTKSLNLIIKSPPVRNIYQTTFDAFTTASVENQDTWVILGDAAQIVAAPRTTEGKQLRYGAPAPDGGGWAWPPVSVDPLSLNRPISHFSIDLTVVDDQVGADLFALQWYNSAGDFLADICFDNNSLTVWRGNGNTPTNLGVPFVKGQRYYLTSRVDWATNTWSAWLNGTQLFANALFHDTVDGVPLNLGDVDLYTFLDGDPNLGVRSLTVDNYSLTSATAAPPIVVASPGSSFLTINDNQSATPNPATLNVSGISGIITKLNVSLRGLNHTYPADMDLLLVAPSGQGVILMSDAGGSLDAVNLTLEFDDLAPPTVPAASTSDQAQLFGRSYRPTDFGLTTDDLWPVVAPATTLAAFNGLSPNGTWKLYGRDDATGDTGSIAGLTLTFYLDNSGVSNTVPTITDVANQTTPEDVPLGGLNFVVGDNETPAAALQVSVTSDNQTLMPNARLTLSGSGANRALALAPAPNQAGSCTITITVTDAGGLPASDSFTLTVTQVNDPPTISALPNQSTNINVATAALPFTINDPETAATALTLTRSSNNTTVLPLANVVLGGSGTARTVTMTPASGQWGTSTITITVSDGTFSTTINFNLTVLSATGDDHGNSITVASPILQPGSPAPGVLTAGDEDFFRVTVPGAGVLIAWTTGDADTWGHLQNAAGGELSNNDDMHDVNFRVSGAVTAGNYYLRVRGFDSFSSGNYTLLTRFIPTTAPRAISFFQPEEGPSPRLFIGFPGISGQTYLLQASSNLAAGGWVTISTFVGNGAESIVTPTGQIGNARRYFRIAQ